MIESSHLSREARTPLSVRLLKAHSVGESSVTTGNTKFNVAGRPEIC